jgi:hypothetical protein
MKYPTYVPKLAPSIYNGGIQLYRHEFDYAYRYASDSNVYSWVETLMEKKYEVGKQYAYKGFEWTVSYIGDRDDETVEITLIRSKGKHLEDHVILIPRRQLAAAHHA